MIPKVPLDTLDFTSYKMNLGSKMIIDATRDDSGINSSEYKPTSRDLERLLKTIDPKITQWSMLGETLLVVTVNGHGRETVTKLTKSPELIGPKIIAAVSPDVDIQSQEQVVWGIFTRFDAERDIVFTEEKLVGISPVFRGKMGIDATWKSGYPAPLTMPEEIIDRVSKRWDSYWKS